MTLYDQLKSLLCAPENWDGWDFYGNLCYRCGPFEIGKDCDEPWRISFSVCDKAIVFGEGEYTYLQALALNLMAAKKKAGCKPWTCESPHADAPAIDFNHNAYECGKDHTP